MPNRNKAQRKEAQKILKISGKAGKGQEQMKRRKQDENCSHIR